MDKKYNYIHSIAFLLVIALQIAAICLSASARTNYFVDELFSFGYAHAYTFDKKDVGYIDQSPEWGYEKWIPNEELKIQLEVSGEESLLKKEPAAALKMLALRRNYHGFLNIIMDVFSAGKPAVWPPIFFNLILFVFTQVLLCRITFGMTQDHYASLLAVVMYGFSAAAINTHIYIRFYALVLFLLFGCIRLHQKMWQEQRILLFSLESILGMILLFFALKNSELIMIIGGALVMAFTAALLIGKRYREAVFYVLLIVPASLLYLIKKTSLINIMLHPADYQNKGGATGWITDNLLTTNLGTIRGLIYKYYEWIGLRMFGSFRVLHGFLVLFIVLAGIRLFLWRKALAKSEKTVSENTSVDASVDISEKAAEGISEKAAEDTSERTAEGTPDSLDSASESRKDRTASRFVWVLFAACAVYFVFALLTGLRYPRYLSFLFAVAIGIFWTLISMLTKGLMHRKYVYAICLLLVLFGAASTLRNRAEVIDYLYTEDRELIEAVQNTDIRDAVVIVTEREDANHSVYDCVLLMPYTARLYPVNKEHQHIDTSDLPDRFLVWSHTKAESTEAYTGDLLRAGYSLELMGTTHTSVVYVAEKG
ncbi:MAG: hypothetical protein J6D53_08665 [Blautia sp.]|nr:hypothetical protein [Blautia sp.]